MMQKEQKKSQPSWTFRLARVVWWQPVAGISKSESSMRFEWRTTGSGSFLGESMKSGNRSLYSVPTIMSMPSMARSASSPTCA